MNFWKFCDISKCEIPKNQNSKPRKLSKWQFLNLLKLAKLISGKIRVVGKLLNFLTVYKKLIFGKKNYIHKFSHLYQMKSSSRKFFCHTYFANFTIRQHINFHYNFLHTKNVIVLTKILFLTQKDVFHKLHPHRIQLQFHVHHHSFLRNFHTNKIEEKKLLFHVNFQHAETQSHFVM